MFIQGTPSPFRTYLLYVTMSFFLCQKYFKYFLRSSIHFPILCKPVAIGEVMSTPEGKVKTKVRAELIKRNVYHFMPATGGYGRSGIPDIVGCYRGYFFAIETKAGAGKTTALQERELQQIRDAGGVAFVINETNVGDIVEWLDGV